MPADDNALMRRVKLQDPLAFELLMKRHRRGVLRFLTLYTGNEETAADLTQETFLRVFYKAHRYQEIGAFKTWLYRIARNLAISHFRRAALGRFVFRRDDPDAALSLEQLPATQPYGMPERAAMNRELLANIERALRKMSPKLKEAFLLCDVMGLSLKEMASVTGTTPATLKVRLFRARRELREKLAPYAGGSAAPGEPGSAGVHAGLETNGGG